MNDHFYNKMKQFLIMNVTFLVTQASNMLFFSSSFMFMLMFSSFKNMIKMLSIWEMSAFTFQLRWNVWIFKFYLF